MNAIRMPLSARPISRTNPSKAHVLVLRWDSATHGTFLMSKQTASPRPLSPHLQVYRWPMTMLTSITHRATGIALSAGAILLSIWVISAATGPATYNVFRDFAESLIGQVILFGFSWALLFHLLNGIRHLYWDAGYGFDNTFAERSSIIVLALSAIVTILVWVFA